MNLYRIPKLTRNLIVDAHWQKPPWTGIPALKIDQFSGQQPVHFPDVQGKLAYDNSALYVIFRVSDRYVCATALAYQDKVCKDSCVEFFFTPGKDITQGYFNLEINCGGTALFQHQKGRQVETVQIKQADFQQLQIAHTLPKIVDPEIQETITWVIEYRLPFDILFGYTQVDIPTSGTSWRANFYKCADGCSHPHWLTWAPVETPEPDFHRPEFFGKLVFE